MPKEKFTDEELEMLSDEERAGLLEDDEDGDNDGEGADDQDDAGSGDDAAAKKEDGAEAGKDTGAEKKQEDDDQDKDDAGDADEDGADDEKDEGDDDEEGAADANDDDDEDEDEKSVDRPVADISASNFPQFEAPADANAKLEEIQRKRDELAVKSDDGDITTVEYRKQDKELAQEEQSLREAMFKASLSAEAVLNVWSRNTVPSFIAQHPEYSPGSPLHHTLDMQVRQLQKEALEAGHSQYDAALLEKAHDLIEAAFRKKLGLPESKETKRKPAQKPTIPPSLGGVPAADMVDTDDGNAKFAALDRLAEKDTEAFEREMAKLPEAEREAYLAQ